MKKEYNFKNGNRGAIEPAALGKTRITIRIDNDILDWFRDMVEQSGGGSYQNKINEVLKDYVKSSKEPLEQTLRRVIREELKKTE